MSSFDFSASCGSASFSESILFTVPAIFSSFRSYLLRRFPVLLFFSLITPLLVLSFSVRSVCFIVQYSIIICIQVVLNFQNHYSYICSQLKQNPPSTALLQQTGDSQGEDKYSIYLWFNDSIAALSKVIHKIEKNKKKD
ncbi:MAG: hypothetical protein HFI14_07965 [Lachnospiraceae bacterium]|nr:hypothetical protein [Lachnospiraceae bacterium]